MITREGDGSVYSEVTLDEEGWNPDFRNSLGVDAKRDCTLNGTEL